MEHKYQLFNEDCVVGSKKHLDSNSVDLIITDPPYGIDGDRLHKHYNRKEEFVIDGYIEVPKDEYAEFSLSWIKEAERVLKPGGTIYIVSGYTNLIDILNALRETKLTELNHLIWKYNFGVFTKRKYVSSHYHILCYTKPGARHTFNLYSRYSDDERTGDGGSLNYLDREDVWDIKREYKPGQIKNKNELPTQLLIKLMQYSSNEGDVVADFFLGSFSTAKVAIGLNRVPVGFELSSAAFEYQIEQVSQLLPGLLLDEIKVAEDNKFVNQGKPISESERAAIRSGFEDIVSSGSTKAAAVQRLSEQHGRGRFSIQRIVADIDIKTLKPTRSVQASPLFKQ